MRNLAIYTLLFVLISGCQTDLLFGKYNFISNDDYSAKIEIGRGNKLRIMHKTKRNYPNNFYKGSYRKLNDSTIVYELFNSRPYFSFDTLIVFISRGKVMLHSRRFEKHIYAKVN